MVTGSSLAQWRPIAGKHYAGRNGLNVTHIDLHIMCGTLLGSDSWFRKPAVKACSHYGIGKTGTIYQWIDEENGSWADANRNADCGGITIEHEGGLKQIACTQECVEASARLCADISRRYGLGTLWHDGLKGNVWLHREIPGTTHADCPDLAPNGLPVQRVIDRANEILRGDDDMVSDQDIDRIAQRTADVLQQSNWVDPSTGQGTAVGGNLYNTWTTAADRASKIWDMLQKDERGFSGLGDLVACHPYGDGTRESEAAYWIKIQQLADRQHALDSKLDTIITRLDQLTDTKETSA